MHLSKFKVPCEEFLGGDIPHLRDERYGAEGGRKLRKTEGNYM